jgi:hypothetical protein
LADEGKNKAQSRKGTGKWGWEFHELLEGGTFSLADFSWLESSLCWHCVVSATRRESITQFACPFFEPSRKACINVAHAL